MAQKPEQTIPNVHHVLAAIRALETTAEVQAYLALQRSIGNEMGLGPRR